MYPILICLLLHVTIGSIAIYYVKVSLYAVFFGVNCVLGVLLFASHTLGNPTVAILGIYVYQKECFLI